ncbi:MAG: C25 family cysteine peptidase [Candidatus Thermoplasmatota archaeon]|nr:C25 family cysteine peptidase [Candidatus Thermoplasmatota archaeon]
MMPKILVCAIAVAFLAAGLAGCIGGTDSEMSASAGVDVFKWTSKMKDVAGDHVMVPLDAESIVAAVPFAMAGEKKLSILSSPLSKPDILLSPVAFNSTPSEISVEAALAGWEQSDGAIVVSDYKQSVVSAPLASFLGVPLLINDGKTDISAPMKALGVKEILCVDELAALEGFAADSIKLSEVNDLVADVAKANGKNISYIALTATDDISEEHPGVKGLSAMAAVLASYHGGIVVQSDEFSLDSKASDSSEGAEKSNAIGELIKSAVKKEAGMLSSKGFSPQYLAIVGCPTTVTPMFEMDGDYMHAIDSFYGDLDDDMDTIELAVGRFVTIDLNDALDLFARTANYQKYLDTHVSPSQLNTVFGDWKQTAGFIYGHGLLEPAWPNTMINTEMTTRMDGQFTTMTMAGAHPDVPGVDQAIWEASNLVYLLVHGSPSGYSCTEGALGPTGADIREWNLGPTVVYASTCLTTKLVGEKIADSFSLNFLHAGGICYVGADQPSSDSLVMIPEAMPANGCDRLGEIFIGHLIHDNMDVGTAFKVSKNEFLAETGNYYTWYEYVLYGDPALNPYEPCNNG